MPQFKISGAAVSLATARYIISLYFDGMISEQEAHTALDKLKIHGGFEGTRYTGFDYENQQWIEEALR